MPDVQLTWLGHGAFRFDTPGGSGSTSTRSSTATRSARESEKEPERVDLIAITHGHGDHVGDTVELARAVRLPRRRAGRARATGSTEQGVADDRLSDPNKGGTVDVDGRQGHAHPREPLVEHATTATYLGEPCGLVVRARGRHEALLRRRHERLRRHGADRADLRAGRRDPADRRPLHDGPEGGGRRARAARRRSAASRATTARSRS